jgi:hypothetical protein
MRPRPVALLLLAAAGLLLAPAPAVASSEGDPYAKVIQDNGPPTSVLSGGAVQILVYPKFSIKLRDGMVVSIKAAAANPTPGAPASPAAPSPVGGKGEFVPPDPKLSGGEQWTFLNREYAAALKRASDIINQDVPGIPVTSDMKLGDWRDGPWFHPGASTPDFLNVDIRPTQESTNYAMYDYITSDYHKGVAYPADQVAFNSNTKLLYLDRTTPKKKLTEAEMLEVNRLFHIMGKCGAMMQSLGQLPPVIKPTG